MIKRLWAKLVQAGVREYSDMPVAVPSSNMDRLFGDCAPAIVAFRIENGFVLRSIETAAYLHGTVNQSGYVYCKDHAAIAEHIVAEATRQRLSLDPRVSKDAIMKQQSLAYGGSVAAQSGSSYNKSP